MSKIHNIWMPLSDVYAQGGPGVYDHFARTDGKTNAILMPISLARDEKNKSLGKSEALDKLKGLSHTSDGDITTYTLDSGLKVLVYHGEETPEKLKEIAKEKGERFTVVTRDAPDHIFYNHHCITVEDPKFLLANVSIVEEGVIEGRDKLLEKLYTNDRSLDVDEAADLLHREALYMNQFVRFRGKDGKVVFARVTGEIKRNKLGHILDVENQRLQLLGEEEGAKKLRIGNHYRSEVLGVKPLDMEQYLALQYGVLNPNAETAFLTGSAGSGKTLLGYLAVDLILRYEKRLSILRGLNPEEGKGGFFERIVLLKPTNIVGGKSRELGFLPGTLWEKLEPHLMPFRDAHRETTLDDCFPFEEMFRDSRRANKYGPKREENKKIEGEAYLPPGEPIELISSGFLRGPSFRNTMVVVDESQNFTDYEMKVILSRGGSGTKFVIMGDPSQFDNPLCSVDLNGLTSAIQFLLPEDNSALIKLPRSYRNQTATKVLDWHVYAH